MKQKSVHWLFPSAALVLVLLLLVKYFYTYVVFPGVPFGYDAGIYRFLFIREGLGFPPFLTPDLPEWAKSHAPGLFFFSSLLTHLGVSPDILIGWVWNIVPVLLALTLAAVTAKRTSYLCGAFVLIAALVSVVQFAGFSMMYYKVFVALFWCTLAFYFFEKRSWYSVLFGMLTIATHQQIGGIFVVATLSSLLSAFLFDTKRVSFQVVVRWVMTCVLGGLWYLPTYQRSFLDILPQVFGSGTLLVFLVACMAIGIFGALLVYLPKKDRRIIWMLAGALSVICLLVLPYATDAPDFVVHYLFAKNDVVAGAFLSLTEYLYRSAPLLLLGLTGLVLSAEKERGTPWQWAALWCGIASVGMFFFYRRFLLPLDFFLLPFAAQACVLLWEKKSFGRGVVSILLLAQLVLTGQEMLQADPHVKLEWLQEFSLLADTVSDGSQVIVLDNMAPWVLGYLPYASVSGPGIFDSRPYDEWEAFLLGSDADRISFISGYPKGTYFYASDVFFSFYPPEVQKLLENVCLRMTEKRGLYQSVCGA